MNQDRVGNLTRPQVAVLAGVVAVGCLLRISYYGRGFSFFHDECALALNIGRRSYAALSTTLAYDQAAPLGFLYLIKVFMTAFGRSEGVLRLLPLLCGIGAIACFYRLSSQFLSGWFLVGANALLCVNQVAISYSSQTKQYSGELLVATLMLLLSIPMLRSHCRSRVFWTNSVVLASLLWFSFSAIFVLAGIGLALALREFSQGNMASRRRLMAVLSLWSLLLVPVYIWSVRPGLANPALRAMWVQEYFPWHTLAQAPRWLFDRFIEVSTNNFNKRLWFLAAVSILFGVASIIRRRDMVMIAGCGAVLACLGGAVVQKYPFHGRLLLFLAPVIILLTVLGYEWIRSPFPRWARAGLDGVAGLAVLWCTASAVNAYGVRPGFSDEPREALRYVRANWQPGDRVYATPSSTPCMLYYQRFADIPSSAIVLDVSAVDGAEHVPTALSAPVAPGRDWLLEMRTPWEKRGESVPVYEYFESRGRLIKQMDVEWTSALLFEVH